MLLIVCASTGVWAEEAQAPSAVNLLDDCPLCTPEEKNLRELARTQAMAESLNQLMEQVQALAVEPQALEALLSGANTAVPNRILRAVRAVYKTPKAAEAIPSREVVSDEPTVDRPATPIRAQRGGADGLMPGFAAAAKEELGIKASAVVLSYGRPIALSVGQSFTHNEQQYDLDRVVSREDVGGNVWHSIVLRGPNNSIHRLELK